jgi:hypothetical protein
MKNVKIYLIGLLGLLLCSCIDNNNKDNNSGAKATESDYTQDAPTYNETRDDVEAQMDRRRREADPEGFCGKGLQGKRSLKVSMRCLVVTNCSYIKPSFKGGFLFFVFPGNEN